MAKFRNRLVFLIIFTLMLILLWTGIRSILDETVIVNFPKEGEPGGSFSKKLFHTRLRGSGVILRVKGGLGNQLYQYACSYALARERETNLYHFILGPWHRSRPELLGPLVLKKTPLEDNEREFALTNFQVPLTHFMYKGSDYDGDSRIFLSDPQLLFGTYPGDKPVLQLDTYAFCESMAYWADYKDEILPMFQFRPEVVRTFPPYVASLRHEIEQAGESVAVHVRRGDFTKFEGYDIPISYQRSAIRRLIKILLDRTSSSPPKFFVFSDDISYARRKLQDLTEAHQFVFVSYFPDGQGNRTSTIQDFFLMTRCKHFIIPNSTFSWWAAWLATNWNVSSFNKGERIVIASAFNPKLWAIWLDKEKEIREFQTMLRSRLYHPKEWIIINTFEGER